jgi:hypothetical protein
MATKTNPSSPQPLRTIFVALLSSMFLLAACGSSADTVHSGSSDATTTVPTTPTTETIPDPEPGGGDDVAAPSGNGTIIGTANIGGEIVDPKPHKILSFEIAESYPEQIGVLFEAGAEPCLAATATATAIDDQVIISLETGITTDALAKSCVAGMFDHRLSIALEEGLDGREVVLAPVA